MIVCKSIDDEMSQGPTYVHVAVLVGGEIQMYCASVCFFSTGSWHLSWLIFQCHGIFCFIEGKWALVFVLVWLLYTTHIQTLEEMNGM